MVFAGWVRTGVAVSIVGLMGYVASIAVLWQLSMHFWAPTPSWWVPAAIASICYAIAVPAAMLAGVVAWDRQR